jgi:serine/threonine protein phosphatase PrpC
MLTGSSRGRAPDGSADADDTGLFPRDSNRVTLDTAGATDKGRVRQNNEDQFLVARLTKSMSVCHSSLPDNRRRHFSGEVGTLMIVADGMGGVAGGATASTLAVETVEDFALNTLKWFLHLGGAEGHALLNELREALERADRAVIERARDNPKLYGMGTTLTMAYVVGDNLFVVHVGDSRAYLLHQGEFEQITNDHTLVQLLVDNGALSPEDARHHKRRHVVTNVVGGPSQGVNVEIHKLKVEPGDMLLLCSDGLNEPVDDAAIAAVLRSETDPQTACDRLIRLAMDAGAPDNVTAVVARFQAG